MVISNPSSVVSFDADAVRRVIEDTVEGSLRSLVEYNTDEFNPLYVDETTLAFYEDEAHMMAHFEEIHSYVDLDFTEQELFTEQLFPVTDRVRYLVTGFDVFTLLRIYVDDEAVFVAIDPDEPIQPLVQAVEDVINET